MVLALPLSGPNANPQEAPVENATVHSIRRTALALISFNALFAAAFVMQLVSAAQILS